MFSFVEVPCTQSIFFSMFFIKILLIHFYFGLVEVCIEKWRNFRDQFIKEKNKLAQIRSGSAGEDRNKKSWKWFQTLSFLNESTSHRETSSNFTISLDDSQVLKQNCVLSY